MQANDLLTFFGLLIAAWAIVPTERLRDFKVRVTWLDWLVVILAVGLVHYQLFLPVLQELGLAADLGPWRWGFTPETFTYLILGVAALVVALRVSRGKLGRRRMGAFREQTEQLLHSARYAELAFLLDRHLPQLVKAHRNSYLLPTLRKSLLPTRLEIAFDPATARVSSKRFSSLLSSIKRAAGTLLPTYQRSQQVATHILRRTLLDDAFQEHLATIDPYLGLKALTLEVPDRQAVTGKWLSALLHHRGSALYYEIEHNQNSSSAHRYEYPEANRIIRTLFRDATLAQQIGIYKPIGDFVLRRLDTRLRKGPPDRYNQSFDAFEEGRWRDPIFAVLRLFDFMVTEAAFQNIRWHMWLYYIAHFVEAIDRNISSEPSVDLSKEWPTPYHYFLYECFSLLWNWIGLAEAVGEQSHPASPRHANTEHESDNIPKSACIALGQAWFTVAQSPRLHPPFKKYLLEATLGRLFPYGADAEHASPLREVAARSIMTGDWRSGSSLNEHQARTMALLESIDHMLRSRVEPELTRYLAS